MKINRTALYLIANLCFALFVAAAFAVNTGSGVHPLYLILLFALCTTAVIEMSMLNGPYVLLAAFSANYFLFYGALDLQHLAVAPASASDAEPFLSATEAVILLGGALVHIAYRFGCRSVRTAYERTPKDWPESVLVIGGAVLWAVSTAMSWRFSVYVIASPTIQATTRGLASLTGLQTTAFMLARLAQPLGILIVAYAQCRYRRGYMAPILIGVVLFQMLFGFVIDFKGEAFLGGVLVVLTKLLVDGRTPKVWLAAMLAFIVVGFPVLQANRVVVRGEHGENSTQVGENIGKALQQAVAGRDKVSSGRDRSQTFIERLSLKASVETIVTKAGNGVPFQYGHTLAPLLTAFVPRLLWPNKPAVAVGQLMNKEFNISDVRDTYISPSHLGDLYWNFGWFGVVFGMGLIGLLLGFLGRRFNLAEAITITRIMVMVVIIRFLILGSEGELSTQYVQWIRSMLAIGVLHWVFARLPVAARLPRATPGKGGPGAGKRVDARPAQAPVAFPNLLR